MCGRYTVNARADDLMADFEVELDGSDGQQWRRYNVAPTDEVPIVVQRPRRGEPQAAPIRQLRAVRWGLVPSWAKDSRQGGRLINARAESLLTAAPLRRAAVARRCLVPADGWYEWQSSPTATDVRGRPRKHPFLVVAADGQRLAFAGVYEFWRDPHAAGNQDAPAPGGTSSAWLVTCAIVTTVAEPGLDRLHPRMPVVLPSERWQFWLDPGTSTPERIIAALGPVAAGRFQASPVSRRVGDVRNDDPSLVEPALPSELDGVVDPQTGEVLGER
ncbi:MAG: SOS response-associated peptidase [Angustibacter sp.]